MEKESTGSRIVDFIKKAAFIDFIKGLHITLRYNVSRSITLRYPDEEKWVPYSRFRGMLTLNKDEEGRELCVACELCSRACPTSCITVIPMEDDTGRGIEDRVAKVWTVDITRCMFCGYCEDACPTTAVRLGREYELACTDLSCTLKQKDELLLPPPTPQFVEGGVRAKARFVRGKDGIKVVADFNRLKKRAL